MLVGTFFFNYKKKVSFWQIEIDCHEQQKLNLLKKNTSTVILHNINLIYIFISYISNKLLLGYSTKSSKKYLFKLIFNLYVFW